VLCNILLSKDDSSIQSKLEKADLFKGRGLTVDGARKLFADYQAAGVQMLICSIYQNDVETLELLTDLKDEFKN
jgi:hypothetical protein